MGSIDVAATGSKPTEDDATGNNPTEDDAIESNPMMSFESLHKGELHYSGTVKGRMLHVYFGECTHEAAYGIDLCVGDLYRAYSDIANGETISDMYFD